MNHWKAIAALAAISLPALAQASEHTLEGQLSTVLVSPETRRLVQGSSVTGSSLGTSLGIAYRGRLPVSGIQHRIHVGLLGLKAKEATGMDGAAPKHLSFGWDLLSGYGDWTFYGGLLGQRWKQSVDAQTTSEFRDWNQAGTVNYLNSPKGTKLGARLGAELAIHAKFSLFTSYTQTEFNKKHNPGWWNLGVVYRGVTF